MSTNRTLRVVKIVQTGAGNVSGDDVVTLLVFPQPYFPVIHENDDDMVCILIYEEE